MVRHISKPGIQLVSVLLAALAALFLLGCPHRSPVWSPDAKHILLLALHGDEELEGAAGAVWMVEVGSGKARRLVDPLPRVRYLAAAWLDNNAFFVLTAREDGGALKEGSEAIWRGTVESKKWIKFPGPPPSSERTPRRNPLAIQAGGGAALVYATGPESVVVVDGEQGKELLRIKTAELVGPGPQGGFLISRPDAAASGLELAAYGSDLKQLWTKPFSELGAGIAGELGKKPVDIVFNDTSTSERLGSPPGSEVGVVLVYTDVSWREGISGYHVRLSGKDGSVLSASPGTAMPGNPQTTGGAVWAVTPLKETGGDDRSAIRTFPLDGSKGEQFEIPGVKKRSIHGYSLSPSGKEFGVVVGEKGVKLLLYKVEGDKVQGKPLEIKLDS